MRVIDFQDDLGASFIAAGIAPPEILKEASAAEPYERRDRDFALILVDEQGRSHRKFACSDPGNTWMSLWYLENVDNGLPDYAVKQASANLYQISRDFGLTDELLTEMFPQTSIMAAAAGQKIEHGKLASALLKTAESTNAPSLCYNHDTGEFDGIIDPWGQRKGLEDVQRDPSSILWFHHAADNYQKTDGEHEHAQQLQPALERLMAMLDQIEQEHNAKSDGARSQALQAIASKHGIPEEEVEQHVAPGGQHAAEFMRMHRAFGAQAPQDKPQKGTAKKASVPHVIGAATGMMAGSRLGAATQSNEKKKPRAALVGGALGGLAGAALGEGFVQHQNRAAADRVIDDFFKGLPRTKVSSHPNILDESRVRVPERDMRPAWQAPAQDKVAGFDKVAELDRSWDTMEPYDRRVAALSLDGLTSVVEIPERIQEYMGHEVGPNLKIAMDARATRIARDGESADNYRRVAAMAKLGSISTEDAVEAIHLLDQGNGINIPSGYGPRIPDPYRCVYGLHKQAMWAWSHGGQYVNEHDLRLFAAAPASKESLSQLFTDAIVEKFRNSPIETFKGMPKEQQMIVARAATQSGYRDTGGLGT